MKANHFLSGLITSLLCMVVFCAVGQPTIGGYNVYFGSLHNHTSVSDGSGTPEQAYSYAKNTAHLDFFGLAEHANMMTGTEWSVIKSAANAYNQDGTFTTFYGFEWTTFFSYGHVAVFNTEDYCSNVSPTNTFTGLLSWLNTRNGVAFFNHPGWDSFAFQEFDHLADAPSAKFIGMELWNDHDGFSKYYYNDGYYSNDGGKGYFDEALSRGWKIGAAGSDDNHTSTWGTATPYRLGILANGLNRSELMNAILARRFFATMDKNLSLSFKINGSEMGSTVTPGAWNVVISAIDADNELFSEVALIKNGVQINSWSPFLAQPVISQNIACNNGDYFYVRVREADGNEAISSPIFISGPTNQPPVVSITSPVNNTVYTVGSPVIITAAASDPEGSVDRVEFYQGSVLLGAINTLPYQFTWSNPPAGDYILTAKVFDTPGASATSAPVSISVQQPTSYFTINSGIQSGSDDAEEYQKGAVDLNSPELKLVYDTKTTGNQTIGLLFKGITVPPGATVTNAYIQFTADKASSGSCNLTIKGQSSNNATTFTATAKNISSRTRTVASVSWSPGQWAAGTAYQTGNIKTIIQEIVNLSGWVSGNNLAIIITGNGTRTAKSYDQPSATPPKIYIEYSTNKSGTVSTGDISVPTVQLLPESEILVYPNPVNNMLTINFTKETEVHEIMVYTVTGNLVKAIKFNQSLSEAQIDCSALQPGIYILVVQSKSGRNTLRFIKQ